MSSSCFGSLDIRSPGVFTETFLDHYHLDICKSNAKTHKIISINRFGITCCYFSSGNIPAIALFAATFLSNLVLSQSNQCFGCGLYQSHCRKLHIQIWLWPGLMIFSVRKPQYFIISHAKSQQLLVTGHRLSCEKGNLSTGNVSLGCLWLLVLEVFLRGLSSPQKPTFPNSNSTRNHVDEEPLYVDVLLPNRYLFIYLFILKKPCCALFCWTTQEGERNTRLRLVLPLTPCSSRFLRALKQNRA